MPDKIKRVLVVGIGRERIGQRRERLDDDVRVVGLEQALAVVGVEAIEQLEARPDAEQRKRFGVVAQIAGDAHALARAEAERAAIERPALRQAQRDGVRGPFARRRWIAALQRRIAIGDGQHQDDVGIGRWCSKMINAFAHGLHACPSA